MHNSNFQYFNFHRDSKVDYAEILDTQPPESVKPLTGEYIDSKSDVKLSKSINATG